MHAPGWEEGLLGSPRAYCSADGYIFLMRKESLTESNLTATFGVWAPLILEAPGVLWRLQWCGRPTLAIP